MAVDQNSGNINPNTQPVGGAEDYEHLLDDYSHFGPPAEGEVLQGKVLKVTPQDVIVDFGYKSEGLVPATQFAGPDGQVTVRPGDHVDVVIDHGPPVEGFILLSHEKAARLRVWDNLEKAFQDQLIISGHVLGRVKGGLEVDVGVKSFMPGSQVDSRPLRNLDVLLGLTPKFTLEHVLKGEKLMEEIVLEAPVPDAPSLRDPSITKLVRK